MNLFTHRPKRGPLSILLIYGSPRPAGTTARLLDAARREAEALGHNVATLHAADLRIAPCRGCLRCRETGRCVQPDDDAQRALQLIRQADVLVVGSPCYWGGMPAPLKQLFDRIVYGLILEHPDRFPSPLHKGKRALLLTACTTPFPFHIIMYQSRGTVRSLQAILRPAGFRVRNVVEKGGTRTSPEPTARELRRIQRALRRL